MKKTVVIVVLAAACLANAAEPASRPAAQPSTQPASQPSTQPSTRPATRLATQPAKELTLDLGGKVSMKLVLIPAGTFKMGAKASERGPQREVVISQPFYMGVYEVTQEQFQAVMGRNPSLYKKNPHNPAEKVTWNAAVEFCQKLSAKTGRTMRLPTEAQWEYACRAGTTTAFSFGDDPGELYKYGNYCDKSYTGDMEDRRDMAHDDGYAKTAPVGTYKPNPWGLYDMHGNVWEWCLDWYDPAYYTTRPARDVDPTGPSTGTERVIRGGCWRSTPDQCRSAHRNLNYPSHQHGLIGFRVVVLEQGPPDSQPDKK